MKSLNLFLIFLFLGFSPLFGQSDESFVYNDRGKRDPFAPLVSEDGRYLLESQEFYTFEDLNLSGILWDPEGRSSALINDQVVKVGESVCGFKIIDIAKDSVTLSKDGKNYIMRVSIEREGE